MASFEKQFTPEEIKALVAHVRKLGAAAPSSSQLFTGVWGAKRPRTTESYATSLAVRVLYPPS